ncbi:hypothetical protein BLOT_010929 [Blomia tropicalis]|nr:hypothetical protein BLOT_010929 [Blomia tropicalis]
MANVQLLLSVVVLTFVTIQIDSKSKCGYSWSKSFLRRHNQYRSKHGVGKLTLDDNIGTFAQPYAEKLVKLGKLVHRHQKNYSENLFYMGEPRVMSSKWLHFTALIWKNTTRVGVGCARSGKKTYVVANYWPHGNIMRHFKDNVLPKK